MIWELTLIRSIDLNQISSVLYELICVFVPLVLCNSITSVGSCDHDHRQHSELLHYKCPLCYPFVARSPVFPQPQSFWKPLICFHFYYFDISRMLYKCYVNKFIQYITCWDWHFSLSISISLRSIQVISCISGSFSFIAG